MHTSSKLNATPRERMLELEGRFPSLGGISRPAVAAAIAGAVLVATTGILGWSAGRSMYGLYGGYAELIQKTAAPNRDFETP